MKILLVYLIFINVISVIVCAADKIKAIKGGWRISEKTLFALSALGGALGMYVTMRIIHHKTKHKRFMIGLPAIIIIQIIILIFAIDNGILML